MLTGKSLRQISQVFPGNPKQADAPVRLMSTLKLKVFGQFPLQHTLWTFPT